MGGEKNVDQWKKDFQQPSPMAAQVWGWLNVLLWLGINTYWVYTYAAESKDMGWKAFLILNLIVIAYAWVMANYVFPLVPSVIGIPFFLIAFLPATLAFCYPYISADVSKLLSAKMPFWQLALLASSRLSLELSLIHISEPTRPY